MTVLQIAIALFGLVLGGAILRAESNVQEPVPRWCWPFGYIGLALLAGILLSLPVSAQTIPLESARYKLNLRQQAQYVWGLTAPVSTFAAQIHTESAWRGSVVSPVGAVGLAQFMPPTATWLADIYPALRENAPLNPTWAMRALATYDKYLFERVSGTTPCERMAFALSAYNGGLGWVNKRKKLSLSPGVCFDATCDINPGISAANQRENAAYPRRVLLRFEPMYVAAGWGPGMCTEASR